MATRTISTKLAIDGESEYRAALSRVNTELKTLQSNLKLTESQYQTNANSMEALKSKGEALANLYNAQKTKVDTLKSALENAKAAHDSFAQKSEELRAKIQANSEALEKLRATTGDTTAEEQKLIKENEALNAEISKNEQYASAAEKGVNAWQTQLNKAQIDLNDLDAELKQNDALLDEAKNSSDGCAHSIDEFGNAVKESSEATDRQNEALDALSAALATGGIVAGIDKIKDALMACVDASVAFEAGMSAVGAIANASAEEMELLSDKALQIGASTKYTAAEASEAMQYMALAGWTAEEMLKGVDGVIQLAAASGENLATVSDIVTDALTAFGLKAEDSSHFVDVLAKTAGSSNTTVTMLGEAFKYAAPLAGALGYSVEDVAVAMGLMADQGIKGSQAGTAMRTMFTKLAGDITLSADAFGKVTISAANADGTMKPLSQSLEELRYYFGQMTEAEKLANAEHVAGKYAMSGLTALMNTTQEDFNSLTKSIQDCSGAAETMAKTRMDNLQGQVTLMKSAFDALKIAIGDDLNPALRDLAETGTDVLTWAADFVNKHEEIVPVVTAVVAGLTTLTGTIAAYTVAKKAVIPVITAFNAALDANPALLAATAIVTLTAALVTLAATMPEDEYKSLTAASKDQYDHLQELNAEYERACTLYGENSEEARVLAAQIEIETSVFDKNKASIQQVSERTNELIGRQRELQESSAAAESSIEKQQDSSEYLLRKLQELMDDEEKSAGTKRQILAVVDLLNEEIPNLGLAYDEYTDSLNLNAEAIQAVIEKEIERERLAANYDELKKEMVLQKDLTEQYATVTDNLAAARQRLADAEAAYEAAISSEAGSAALSGITEYLLAVEAAEYEVELLEGQETSLSAALEVSSEKVDDLTDSYEELNEEVSNNVDASVMAADSVKGSLEELAEAYKDAFEEAKKSLDGQFGLWEEAVTVSDQHAKEIADALSKGLEDAYSAAEKSVKGQYDLMEEAVGFTGKKAGEMIHALESQAEYWEWYQSVVAVALDSGIDGVEEFVACFLDGSQESGKALVGFATATDEEKEKIIAAFQALQKAQSDTAAGIAELKTQGSADMAELSASSKKSIDDMIAAQESQQEYWQEYSDNMDALLAHNVAGVENLAAKLSDGSQESAEALAALSTASDEEIARILESMGKVEDSKNSLSGTFAQLNIDLSGELDGLANSYSVTIQSINGTTQTVDFSPFVDAATSAFGNVGATFETAGNDAGTGLQNGIVSSSGQVYTAANAMGQGVIDALRAVLDSHSPSNVTDSIGQDAGQGLANGLTKSKDSAVVPAVEEIGREIIEKMESTGKDSVERFTNEFDDLEDKTRDCLRAAKKAVNELTPDLSNSMENVGVEMIQGMINGLYNQSGSLYNTVAGIVYNAIETARAAAGVHSPSWKTEAIFEDVGEGMVVGVEKKKDDVAEATQGVVDEALTLDMSGIKAAMSLLDMKIPDMSSLIAPYSGAISAPQGATEINVNIEMNGTTIREDADIDRISDAIVKKLLLEVRQKGR